MTDRQHRLLQTIQHAFRRVELGDGISLHETVVIDDYGGREAQQVARIPDEKHDWRKLIDDPELARICGVGGLSFYDAVGLRFHLPAYLSLAVQYSDRDEVSNVVESLLFHLTHVSEYNLERFSILDDAQRRCVWEVLLYLRDVSDLDPVTQSYWNREGRE
jgi:hypothetical protein